MTSTEVQVQISMSQLSAGDLCDLQIAVATGNSEKLAS